MKLTKNLLILISICVAHVAHGQIKNIPITDDSTVTLDAIYVGIAGWNSFYIDSLSASRSVTFRAGESATWKITNSLAVNSFTVVENGLSGLSVFGQIHLRYTPSSKWKIQVGNLPTLSTEQRPLPYTGPGQFESWSESKIPGIAPGVKVKYLPKSSLSFGVGVADRNKMPEYHASVSVNELTLSGYCGTTNSASSILSADGKPIKESHKYFGSAFTYNGSKVYTTAVFRNEEVIANLFVLSLGNKIQLYSDAGYSLKDDRLVRGEWGLLKNFQGKLFAGLLGVGYAKEVHAVKGYLFVHL